MAIRFRRVVAETRRAAGRPSLTTAGERSPKVEFRASARLKARLEQRAAADGTSVSQVAREALERCLAS